MFHQLRHRGYIDCANFIQWINDDIEAVREDHVFHATVKRCLRALTSNEPITRNVTFTNK